MAQQLRIAVSVRVFLLALGLACAVRCGPRSPAPPRNQPGDPLFAGLTAPPLNQPAVQFGIKPVTGRPYLPEGGRPALVLVSDSHPVRAIGALPGTVTARDGRIEVLGSDGTRVEVLYRLPQALAAPPQLESTGDLSVFERARPSGDPGGQVLVCSEGSLMLARISLVSPKPLRTELGAGLGLRQRQGSGVTSQQGSEDLEVEAFDEEHVVGIVPVGKPTPIRTSTGVFQALVESSRHDSSYTLEAWVVRSK